MYSIDDKRTKEEKENTIGYIVANDSFMSGWGNAPGRSIFAIPVNTWHQFEIVENNMRNRSEMKYVRQCGRNWRPKLRDGDHLSIRSPQECSRFFEVNGF